MSAVFARAFVLLGIIGLFAQVPEKTASAQETKTKKVIYYGWGSPDAQYVRDHWRQMEEMPFDGAGIVVPVDRRAWQQGKRDTGNQLGWQVMGKKRLRMEDFRAAIEDLKTAKWSKFHDNFLPVALSASGSAGGLSWFDDERWRAAVNNFEVLTRVAADGGIKGLILDPEHYKYALFDYSAQQRQLDRPFEEYAGMARQRGREVMSAIARVMQRPVILALYSYSKPLSQMEKGAALQRTAYGLLPAFYDGLLEAMPSGGKLIDGYEHAYGYKERRQFAQAYKRIQAAHVLSSVPDDYRDKVKAGFGLWIDNRRNPHYFTAEEFERAVLHALDVSDEYVWIYSHRVRFFPPSGVDPSYIEALANAGRKIKRTAN